MRYEIRWTDVSLRQLEKLDKKQRERIFEKTLSIAENPFSFIKKLKGFNLYALRIGDYRVIMSIENKLAVIFVLDVGNRSVIYKKY
jgi:mRNA interferase RelE/StbE